MNLICKLTYYRANQIELVSLDFSGLPDGTPTVSSKYITNANTVNTKGAQIIETYHASATLMGQSVPQLYFTYSTTQTEF